MLPFPVCAAWPRVNVVLPILAEVVISAPSPATFSPEERSPAPNVRVVVMVPDEPVTVLPDVSHSVADVPRVMVWPLRSRSLLVASVPLTVSPELSVSVTTLPITRLLTVGEPLKVGEFPPV